MAHADRESYAAELQVVRPFHTGSTSSSSHVPPFKAVIKEMAADGEIIKTIINCSVKMREQEQRENQMSAYAGTEEYQPGLAGATVEHYRKPKRLKSQHSSCVELTLSPIAASPFSAPPPRVPTPSPLLVFIAFMRRRHGRMYTI